MALTHQSPSTSRTQPKEPTFLAESFIQLCENWTPRPNKRILLVDDDEDTRKTMRAFLEMEHYTVFSCSDGQRALDLLRRHTAIDLLVTDLHMPNVSGSELAGHMSQLLPSVPVLMISGAILPDALRESFAVRGWHFLAKPFPVTMLLRRVRELLQFEADAARAAARSISRS